MTSTDLHCKGGGDTGTMFVMASAAIGTGVVRCSGPRTANGSVDRGCDTKAAGNVEELSIERRPRDGFDGEAGDGRVAGWCDGRVGLASRTSEEAGAGRERCPRWTSSKRTDGLPGRESSDRDVPEALNGVTSWCDGRGEAISLAFARAIVVQSGGRPRRGRTASLGGGRRNETCPRLAMRLLGLLWASGKVDGCLVLISASCCERRIRCRPTASCPSTWPPKPRAPPSGPA